VSLRNVLYSLGLQLCLRTPLAMLATGSSATSTTAEEELPRQESIRGNARSLLVPRSINGTPNICYQSTVALAPTYLVGSAKLDHKGAQ